MLDPDNDQCVPKIPHCKAPLELQPQGLAIETISLGADKYDQFWHCNECEYGFFLD